MPGRFPSIKFQEDIDDFVEMIDLLVKRLVDEKTGDGETYFRSKMPEYMQHATNAANVLSDKYSSQLGRKDWTDFNYLIQLRVEGGLDLLHLQVTTFQKQRKKC